jgi:hypothetical protein
MNLIEKLGGYEKAKYHRDYLIDFGNEFNRPNKHEVDSLNDALLEYRRENNIFEVGDSVVLLKFQHMWHDMKSLYVVESLEVYDRVTIGISIRNKNTSLGGEIRNIRHATPEEIKAGHRL